MFKDSSCFVLKWIGAPRPPVHPNEMEGTQSFATLSAVHKFMKSLPDDAKIVGCWKRSTVYQDVFGNDFPIEDVKND